MLERKKVDVFEFYFSIAEYYTIYQDAVQILKNFTAFPAVGCWKQNVASTYVIVFIATKDEHYFRVQEFLKILKEKLKISHYVKKEAEFYIDKEV